MKARKVSLSPEPQQQEEEDTSVWNLHDNMCQSTGRIAFLAVLLQYEQTQQPVGMITVQYALNFISGADPVSQTWHEK